MTNRGDFQNGPPLPPPAADEPMPARAALCALIPGIGAVYNREYMKAVVHFSIFAGFIIIAESVGVFGLAAVVFYIYTIIDAFRSAEAIARRGGWHGTQSGDEEINLPVWGGVLLTMGVLFLLDNLGVIRLRSVVQFWPIILIALGGYLIYQYYQRRTQDTRSSAPRSSSHPHSPVMPPGRQVSQPSTPDSEPERPSSEAEETGTEERQG